MEAAFTLLIEARAPGNGSTFRGITINKSYIREWYNKRIKINLNRALSPYLKPGYTYRILLKKKLTSGYRTVAVGPTGILSRNCTSASINNSGSPVIVGQKTYVARFTGFTLNTRVILGNSVTFTGHLKASNRIADSQFRLHPMSVTFVIINKQTKVVVTRKLITLKGKRVTFNISGIPKTTGQYILRPKVSGYGATGYRISHPGLLRSKATVINSPIRRLPVIYFRSSNPVRNSKVGQWLYFGGVFSIRDNAFYNRMRTIGFARVNWSVVSITGNVAGRGTHRITGKRSSLFIKVKPGIPGKYYLKLSLSGGNGVRFGLSYSNLKGIIVRVTRDLSYGRKPKY